ncbi:MAG: bifunctional oligoribonuclease/PAP phosphatase NrnA [Balneolaceae bacterium]
MYKNLISKLLSYKNIAVFSHVKPDGDCLGSQVALCLWLQKNGVDCSAFNEDDVNQNLLWLTNFFPISKPDLAELDKFDAFLFLDGNALHRFGENAERTIEFDKPLYMIDHHPQPDDVFDTFISVTDASSTCELVYELIAEHDIDQIDAEIAKSLFVGIVTDTGSFQFNSVKPSTLRAAANLLEKGDFTPPEVVERIYSSKSLNQIQLLGMSLETISLHGNQQIATMYVTQAMFDETQTTNADTEGFVSYPLSIEGVKACIFFREDGDKIKLSLRSRSEIDVNVWARKLNGGGHKKAAGGIYSGTIENAVKDVVSLGLEQL